MSTIVEPLAGSFSADPFHSSIQFSVPFMRLGPFRARFGEFEAKLVADDSGVRLQGKAPAGSVSITDPPQFREHVVESAEFFDAKSHPDVTFEAKPVRFGEDGSVDVDGTLTIKGIARPVHATGTFRPTEDDPFGGVRAAIDLEAVIDRREWGMEWQQELPDGGDFLGYDVEMSIALILVADDQQPS